MDQQLFDALSQVEGWFPKLGSLVHLINSAIALAYRRGLFDGAVAGILVALLLMPSPKTRVIVVKGEPDVQDH